MFGRRRRNAALQARTAVLSTGDAAASPFVSDPDEQHILRCTVAMRDAPPSAVVGAAVAALSSASATPTKSRTPFCTSVAKAPWDNVDGNVDPVVSAGGASSTKGETGGQFNKDDGSSGPVERILTPAKAALAARAAQESRKPRIIDDVLLSDHKPLRSSPSPPTTKNSAHDENTPTTTPTAVASENRERTAGATTMRSPLSYFDTTAPTAQIPSPESSEPSSKKAWAVTAAATTAVTESTRKSRKGRGKPKLSGEMEEISASASRSNTKDLAFFSTSDSKSSSGDRWYTTYDSHRNSINSGRQSIHAALEPNFCSCTPPPKPDNWSDSMWCKYLAKMARLPCKPCGWAGGTGPVTNIKPTDYPKLNERKAVERSGGGGSLSSKKHTAPQR